MAIINMTKRSSHTKGWYHEEIILDSNIGNDIFIPPLLPGKRPSCTLIAGTNIGKFQVTTSSDEDVKAGTAIWQDWTKGDSTGTVTDVIVGQVTGIRGVSVSGEVKIEIVI